MTYSAASDLAKARPRCGELRHRSFEGGFEDARAATRDMSQGDHATLTYDDPELLAPFCARYLTEGIDAGERVLAMAPADLRAPVERLLAPDATAVVEWMDAVAIYGDVDADRVAAMYDDLIGGERRVMRILAVFDRACAAGADAAEWDRYECMAHSIITRYGAMGLCLYDTRGLDPSFVEVAIRRHGLAVRDGEVRRNERFEYQPA